MSSLLVKGVIRNGRVEVAGPIDLPDGTEVVVSAEASSSEGADPVPPEEITRVLAAIRQLQPLDIPADTAADLDAWERKPNQHGIDNSGTGLEDVFR